MTDKELRFTNDLIRESSPYLLQHAYNPVLWQPWSDAALAQAQEEDKPLLVSIGYAACHWCHVMAHETFEDPASARIMNDHFICVKVDREERPDVDNIYMEAVQMMTGSGGWPLHVFLLPDGRPFFGGTYFPTDQWQQVCHSAANAYSSDREKVIAYAEKLEKGLRVRVPVINSLTTSSLSKEPLKLAAASLQARFDGTHGGFQGAPKFPMPVLLNFLHDYSLLAGDAEIGEHVRRSLQHMSLGGIYDHVGGGFARYSVDSRWKVPHFEKMLYDNAQLLTLLSKVHRVHPSPLFDARIRETADFMVHDLATGEGLFASSLDADSEGSEGKFYVWEKPELESTLGHLFSAAQKIFSVDPYGYWEKNTYILQMASSPDSLAKEMNLSLSALQEQVSEIKKRLFNARIKRVSPALDDKALVSWNALAIEGLVHASIALNDPRYLKAAQTATNFILDEMRMDDGGLLHVYAGGRAYIPGFLEDYSGMISALITLYQADLDELHLLHARSLMKYVFDHFLDRETGFFYFTAIEQTQLIKRDIDLTDGVIPSANSMLGHALIALSRYFEIPEWEAHARKMAANMADELSNYPGSYSHWASLNLSLAYPYFDVAIIGSQAHDLITQLQKVYHPNTLFSGSPQESDLPILSGRFQPEKTLAYVCRDKVCGLPLETIGDVQQALNRD